ncbi:hypothetical protein LTR36_006463 [Oleoguttula mirabilis]|uniref:RING-type domain-containing protein n=1 Tax=Oleoguttula mirabilis TaxID=1507867 RepID=A0AAV9JWJ6_9PEZI|nr:hypothetical protein LTR36_006463 [Oleoguttula mirabilis]
MASQTPWEVLNEADDETAQLMIKLQLDDIAAASTTDDVNGSLALQAYEAELRQYHAVRQYENEETDLAEASAAAAAASADEEEEAPEAPTDDVHQHIMLFQCVACRDPHDSDHCYQVPCQHYYCDECLGDLFSRATTDESLYPPRCCRTDIPFEDISTYLPDGVRTKFERKMEELDDRARVYCRRPSCGASAELSSATPAARRGRPANVLSGRKSV